MDRLTPTSNISRPIAGWPPVPQDALKACIAQPSPDQAVETCAIAKFRETNPVDEELRALVRGIRAREQDAGSTVRRCMKQRASTVSAISVPGKESIGSACQQYGAVAAFFCAFASIASALITRDRAAVGRGIAVSVAGAPIGRGLLVSRLGPGVVTPPTAPRIRSRRDQSAIIWAGVKSPPE
jgi:hypothetical protein